MAIKLKDIEISGDLETVLVAVRGNPGMTFKELAAHTGLVITRVHYYVRALADMGLAISVDGGMRGKYMCKAVMPRWPR